MIITKQQKQAMRLACCEERMDEYIKQPECLVQQQDRADCTALPKLRRRHHPHRQWLELLVDA